jgi:hypothetical protein
MTTLKVNAIEPEGATTNLTVGMTGQNVVIGGSGGIKANTFKDAGGNTLWTSNGSGVLSSVSGFGGAQVLISSQTASNSASLSFTSGLTSTYKEYVFEFININPATDGQHFGFQVNASGESGYNETITSTFFRAYNFENDAARALDYLTATDQAQGTAAQQLFTSAGNDADKCVAGELHLFNPASTTYVKNFYATTNGCQDGAVTQNEFAAGYINVTAAITAIQFAMSSGNFDGKIKMYGVK